MSQRDVHYGYKEREVDAAERAARVSVWRWLLPRYALVWLAATDFWLVVFVVWRLMS